MKIGFFVLIMLAVTGQALSQAVDSLAVDSVKLRTKQINKPARKYGVWVAGYVEPAYLRKANGVNLGGGLSFLFRSHYHVGAYGSVYMGDYNQRLIFPNEFSMKYSQAGLWAGYKTTLEKPFQFTFDARVGQGKVFWERRDNFYNMFEDYALFVQPSAGCDYKFLPFAILHGEVGYRLVKGLDIPEISDDDFSGLTLNVMIKIGLF
ncbi:MAG: hypothetical protein ACMVP2_27355 [Imperialibacter sp.]|uniref:hypothetical protein n=1 Tax=Imperialibacter sp. TaxID=2038411 RepID=UPI003A8A1406